MTFRHRRRIDESESERAVRDTALMGKTLDDGQLMLSTTDLGDQSTLRFVVMNHRTTKTDFRHVLVRIREFAT